MAIGRINKLETFGSVDGPGIRFVVFTQGCPMRCQFCHNPETWDFGDGLFESGTDKNAIENRAGNNIIVENRASNRELRADNGESRASNRELRAGNGSFEISAEELLKKALRYKTYWGKDGGITVSGGEPLVQIDFLIEFFEAAKAAGIHTCIDTSGVNFTRSGTYFEKFQRLMKSTDLLLVDIKIIDPDAHKVLTGHGNANIIDMFRYLDEIKKPIWIRHVLVPGISDNDELLIRTREFIRTLSNVKRVDVLPYHAFALAKYEELGISYPLRDTESPSAERVENANRILETAAYSS